MASAATMTQPGATASGPAGAQRWLYGPWIDLVLGCGGLYAIALVLLYFTAIGRIAVESGFVLGGLLALFVNGPHYGATLLRVYEHRAERRKYAFFAVHTTILLAVLFVTGLYVHWLGSLVLTIYFTWTPWHFSGQNYGLAVLFLRRRGIDVTPAAKRALYGCFVLSCAVTLLSLHGIAPQLGLAPVPSADGSAFRFLSLGIPDAVRTPLLLAAFAAYVGSIVLAGVLLLRKASVRDLVPSACLVLAQASWFAIPAMLHVGGTIGLRNVAFSTVWIALAHSVQYLWVTSYFAKNTGSATSLPTFLAKCLVAGATVIVLPAVLMAPDAIGPLPYDAGLAVLLFSVVNLHHFILDGAIWKLRDGRVARVLIRRSKSDNPEAESSTASFKFTVALAIVGIVALGIEVTGVLERDGVNRAVANKDVSHLVSAAHRLDLLGRESAHLEARLAVAISERGGSSAEVRARLERSLELRPDAEVWHVLGQVEMTSGDPAAAARAFDAAVGLDPSRTGSWRQAGEAWAAAGDSERALDALERARELAPEEPGQRRLREQLEANRGGL